MYLRETFQPKTMYEKVNGISLFDEIKINALLSHDMFNHLDLCIDTDSSSLFSPSPGLS